MPAREKNRRKSCHDPSLRAQSVPRRQDFGQVRCLQPPYHHRNFRSLPHQYLGAKSYAIALPAERLHSFYDNILIGGSPRIAGWGTWSGPEGSSHSHLLRVPGVRLAIPFFILWWTFCCRSDYTTQMPNLGQSHERQSRNYIKYHFTIKALRGG